jgi:hypothetical protein
MICIIFKKKNYFTCNGKEKTKSKIGMNEVKFMNVNPYSFHLI